jgi:hypothetical protein
VALPLKSETLNQVFIGTFNGDRLAYFERGVEIKSDENKVLAQGDTVDVVSSLRTSSE